MKRIVESELMETAEQAAAYAQADFNAPHGMFMELFDEEVGEISGRVLELGCGTCDVTIRFAKGNPNCVIFAVDGSREMLKEGQKMLEKSPEIKGRIFLIHDRLETLNLPEQSSDVIISNSLLHHLHKPHALWNAIRLFAQPNAWIFIMDLLRPSDKNKAKEIVETYAKNEQSTLKADFLNSLCAAFEPEEVKAQLKETGLEHLKTKIVSDRHMIIFGRM